MTKPIQLKGQIVTEWLDKWPNVSSLQLARMIYNADDNHKAFRDIENVRSVIRYYRLANGKYHRKHISTDKYARTFKIIAHEQIQSTR